MPDPRFIGLVHSLLASAQASLGEAHSPMGRHLERDGVRSRRTAERSVALLRMLHAKTTGNLDETERAALVQALSALEARVGTAAEDDDAEGDGVALPMHGPSDVN